MKAKIKTYFRNKGFYDYRRGWDKGTCLYCGSPDKAGVNLYRDFYHCFVCEEKGRLVNVIQDVEDLKSFGEVVKLLHGLEETEYFEPKVKRPDIPEFILPEGYINLRRGSSEVAERARDYITRVRRIPLEAASKAGLGYVPLPESPYFGRIIIPFIRDGVCIYFQGRSFLKIDPKITNPDIDKVGVGKATTIYNHDALKKYEEVDIVESAFNALTLGKSSTGINGKSISSWQLGEYIKASKPKLYNIILDPDALEEYSWDLARRLVIHKKVRVIPLFGEKDVNDLGKDFIIQLKSKTPILHNIRDINKLANETHHKPKRFRSII